MADFDPLIAARHAPLVRVWPADPPADPDLWLAEADLLRYDEAGSATRVCAAADLGDWPADAREPGARPQEQSAAGLALVPRRRAPKFVATGSKDPSFGRLPLRDGEVVAPCFYESEGGGGHGVRLTYWFFFPTSTTPANTFAQMAPLMIDALRENELLPDEFPPVVDPVPRRAIDLFWESVAARWAFGAQFVRGARNAGVLATAPVALGYQMLGQDAIEMLAGLDPVLRERIASMYVHEGDWEGISVDLDDSGAFRQLIYWAHGKPVVDARTVLQTVDGVQRYVVDVAVGSHAAARPIGAEPGLPGIVGPAARILAELLPGAQGALWRTWTDLRPVQSAAWYGFAGAWGRPRLPPVGSLARRSIHSFDLWLESTGPLGPGREKAARNRHALQSLGH